MIESEKEDSKKPLGTFALKSGWWPRYAEDERPALFVHQMRDRKITTYWCEILGRIPVKYYEEPSTRNELGLRQSTYGWVTFDHQIDDEVVVMWEDRPAFFWEHDHKDPVKVPTRVPLSKMLFTHPSMEGISQEAIDGLAPFLGELRGERRLIGMRNTNSDFRFEQNIQYGPPLLKFDKEGLVVDAYAGNVKGTFKIGRDKFDKAGRWTSSEYEYMCREIAANPNMSTEVLA